ncbi:MAG: hypothetical protein R3F11_27935 [Verrucomicrobiales bacterium]
MLLLIVFALVSRAERRKKIALRLALIAALIMTNPVASGLVFKAWEIDAMPMAEIADPYDYAIVLGGFSRPGRYPDDRIHLSGDPNRLIHAFELYMAGKVRKIVISGGAANVIGEKIGEAPGAKAFSSARAFQRATSWSNPGPAIPAKMRQTPPRCSAARRRLRAACW